MKMLDNDSVYYSFRTLASDPAWNLVRNSIYSSIRISTQNLIWESVRIFVGDSNWISVKSFVEESTNENA
jgi:hypothetical protein